MAARSRPSSTIRMPKSLEQTITSLRADLMATNAAVLAVLRSMTPEQRERALEVFAQISAQRQVVVESIATPVQRQMLQEVQDAEERLHQAMVGAHKLQTAHERER
jgi:RecA/RadA recombinase